MRSSPAPVARSHRQGGFVLLEVLVALVIFATIVLAYAKAADNALEASAEANSTRTLRLLTSRKLAEIRAKPAEYREGGEGGFEEELGVDDVNPFLDYRWSAEAREVVVAGNSTESGVEYLNPIDEAEDPPKLPDGKKAPDPILLVQIALTVSRASEGEAESERMKVFTFLPIDKDKKK
jgi:prepilin-type N-terminal cleavage/methylation domain-containing protein